MVYEPVGTKIAINLWILEDFSKNDDNFHINIFAQHTSN